LKARVFARSEFTFVKANEAVKAEKHKDAGRRKGGKVKAGLLESSGKAVIE
jgi:hypothetical protein